MLASWGIIQYPFAFSFGRVRFFCSCVGVWKRLPFDSTSTESSTEHLSYRKFTNGVFFRFLKVWFLQKGHCSRSLAYILYLYPKTNMKLRPCSFRLIKITFRIPASPPPLSASQEALLASSWLLYSSQALALSHLFRRPLSLSLS